MRLTQYEIDNIKNNLCTILNKGRILLFGSRVDDSLKGRDIDLCLETFNRDNLYNKIYFYYLILFFYFLIFVFLDKYDEKL